MKGPQRTASVPPAAPGPLGAPLAPSVAVHPAAVFHVASRDAFREKAERDARRKAERAVRKSGALASAIGAAARLSMAPFPRADAPAPAPALIEPRSRIAVLAPLSARLRAKTEPSSDNDPLQPLRSAAIIPWPRPLHTAPLVLASAAAAPPADPPAASEPARGAEMSPRALQRRGGGSSGDGGGGNGTAFNQDDIAGATIVVLMLLLLGWMGVNWLGRPASGDRALMPEVAAVTPAPRKDPFPPGPVDLTPKSPLPEPIKTEPAKTELAKATPQPVPHEPFVTAQAAPTPPMAAAAPLARTCAPDTMIHAYFCTSQSELTPAARAALDRQLAAWRACAAGQELVVRGYADTRGTPASNAVLGESRARQMADILRAQGLTVGEVKGVGELDGLDDQQNCANQRRVDVGLRSQPLPGPSRACTAPREAPRLSCSAPAAGTEPTRAR